MLHFLEIADGLFALDDEAQGDGLYPSGGKTMLAEFVAECRRDLVAIETVEHAPTLLGEKEAAVDLPWRSNRLVDSRLGNLVEGDPLVDVLLAKHLRQVPGDGLPFAVRVGCQPHLTGRLCQLAQPDDDRTATISIHVLRPVVRTSNAHFILREVTHMAGRGSDLPAVSEVVLDVLDLVRRLHDEQAGHDSFSCPFVCLVRICCHSRLYR